MYTNFIQATHAAIDIGDFWVCRLRLLKAADWETLNSNSPIRLYAGKLSRHLPQWNTHVGLTPYFPNSRNIPHDVRSRHPLQDGTVDLYQSEDVYEHLEYSALPFVISEIYRILRPGGLLRLSVPDYRCSFYRDRSIRSESGEIIFDPGGGGSYVNGRPSGGAHLWFPTIESVTELFNSSPFNDRGQVRYLQYNAPDGTSTLKPIDYSLGHIQRTPDHDHRGSGAEAISIVVDAVKL